MITEARFKLALREMMQSKPLSEINVTALCEKLSCHRQTFYYHYQDLYDLLESVYLNEAVPGIDKAKDLSETLNALLEYALHNFSFLRSTYQSAASDLADGFFYNKIIAKMLQFYFSHSASGITKVSYRNVCRRFASNVSREFGYWFVQPDMSQTKLERAMRRYLAAANDVLYPAFITLGKEEKKR